jgi:hypothetical protein
VDETLAHHHIDLQISTSSSDSGDTIETAGYIFYKHPTFTHRFYYLKQLHLELQASTPFLTPGFIAARQQDNIYLIS